MDTLKEFDTKPLNLFGAPKKSSPTPVVNSGIIVLHVKFHAQSKNSYTQVLKYDIYYLHDLAKIAKIF